MQKKVVVLSLGGSLIIPNDVDFSYLKNFKKTIKANSGKFKFIIVCGGGSVARKYISALEREKISRHYQSLAGISATRTNARFMSYFFNQDSESGIPQKMEQIHNYLRSQNIVFCGALEYKPNQTSDSTSAEIAKHFKTIFINLTDVDGLHDKNPKKFRDAKFISKISWKDFHEMANKIKYKPGQHFVLDQKASKIILDEKIPTYILGKDLKQLSNLLSGKKFRGTEIKN
ncbi:UMP kinase [Candidatus Pacearchaeota archaeon]|nr:UMP kinase [Candidatus Pacearchaeota archaeon]